ncbi:ATP-binding protein [Consotaella salsifontis]|uniref:AAA domain-containing protein n=1 Tax=Consotaella salsifontis TaxID=1365950 RepID=A0A1T4RWB4_9HYPH|nr:ATP-binding protein [Consotaella salsifontis]SKA20177.1 AAA domain-containing protein [Consotaella salsifontis]
MAISLAGMKTTKSDKPPVFLIYGVDGVGKTSLAAEFPDPIYLPTEGEEPPSDIEMPTPGTIESFDDLLNLFAELLTEEHDRKTAIVDSLDGLENLVWQATCRRLGVSSIEEPGFGKGYVEADTEWLEYLSAVLALKSRGVAVVQLAHPEIVRFDSPISDPYSRYGIKLHKRANALVREKADIVAFMNYRISIKEKEVARQTKVAHAEGGQERQIHLAERAGFTAKNRYGMPDVIPYRKGEGYSKLCQHFPHPTGAQ